MSVASTTPLSFTITSSSTLNAVDVTNGQIVALNNADGLYYDMGNSRHKITDEDPDRVKTYQENLVGYTGTVMRFGADVNGNYGYYDHSNVFHKWRNPQGDASQNDVFRGSTFSNARNYNLSGTVSTVSTYDLGDVPGQSPATITANGTYYIGQVQGGSSGGGRIGAKEVTVRHLGSTFTVNVPSGADPTNLTTYSGSMTILPSTDNSGYSRYYDVITPSGKLGMTTVSLNVAQQSPSSTFSGTVLANANNVYVGDTSGYSYSNVMRISNYYLSAGMMYEDDIYRLSTANMGNAAVGNVKSGESFTSVNGIQLIGTWKTYSHQLYLRGRKVSTITLPSDVDMYTHKLGYGWTDRQEFFFTTRYYKTSGLSNNGTITDGTHGYSNNESEVKVINVTARYVTIFVKYETEDNYDWGCIWKGSHSDYTAGSNYNSSFTGRLMGSMQYKMYAFDINSDSVLSSDKNFTVGWKSDSSYNSWYGMYVTVIQNANAPYLNPYYTWKPWGVGLYAAYDPKRNGSYTPLKIDAYPSLGSAGVMYIFHNDITSMGGISQSFTYFNTTFTFNMNTIYDNGYISLIATVNNISSSFTTLTLDKSAMYVTMIAIPESPSSIVLMYMWATSDIAFSVCKTARLQMSSLPSDGSVTSTSWHLTSVVSMGSARTSRASTAVAGAQWEDMYLLSPAVPRAEGSSYDVYQHHYSYNYAANGLEPTYMNTCGSTYSALGSLQPTVWTHAGANSLTSVTGESVCNGSTLYGRHSILPYIGCRYVHSDNSNLLQNNPYGVTDGYNPASDDATSIIYDYPYMLGRIQQYALVISTECRCPLYLKYSTYDTANKGFQLYVNSSTSYGQSYSSGGNISNTSKNYSAHIYDLSGIGGDIRLEQSGYSRLLFSCDKYDTNGVIFQTTYNTYDGEAEVKHIFTYDNTFIICIASMTFGFFVNITELFSKSGSAQVWPFYFLGSCPVSRTQAAEALSAFKSDLTPYVNDLREVSGPHQYDITFASSNNS